MNPDFYAGREQASVKHFVLGEYLEVLVAKLAHASGRLTLNYVDGFSGPWKGQDPAYSDTSPYVALEILGKAQEKLRAAGVTLNIRGLFIEEDAAAHAELARLIEGFREIPSVAVHGTFEEQIPRIVEFSKVGIDPFAFILIDPTGWTGYRLASIAPLLQLKRREVLINFMLEYIRRFVDSDDPAIRASFEELFGSGECRDRWKGLSGDERDDAITEAYCEIVRRVGRIAYCVSSIILDPHKARTLYRLIYATDSLKGLVAFREVEQRSIREQDARRGEARHRKRTAQEHGQSFMFVGREMIPSDLAAMVDRYHQQAKVDLTTHLGRRGTMPYDDCVSVALAHPFTSESILKSWVREWKQASRVVVDGLAPGKHVPGLRSGHSLRWLPHGSA